MKIIKEAFSCTNPDGYQINGMVLQQEDINDKAPALILSHGFTSNMSETMPYGEEAAGLGYRVFVYDFCGGGLHSSSEGSFEDYMTPLTEKGDLLQVLAYVRNRTDVDQARIVLGGCSQGGFVSSLAASEADGEICGLLLQYPAMCIPDDARAGSMQIIHFDPKNIPDHVGEPPMRVSGAYPASVIKMDVFTEIKGYHGPVMISHGTLDSIVPVVYAEKAYMSYQENGNDVSLRLVKGCDHGFHGAYFAEGCSYMKEFLKRFL